MFQFAVYVAGPFITECQCKPLHASIKVCSMLKRLPITHVHVLAPVVCYVVYLFHSCMLCSTVVCYVDVLVHILDYIT